MATRTVDNIIDSIQSPQTTGQPIPPQIMKAAVALGYVAGNSWLTFEPYKQARPDLVKQGRVIPVSLTYAVPRGIKWCMYDMEKGGGRPENIGAFGDRVDRSEPFLLYTFASAGEAMLAWAKHFGFVQGRDFYYVSAHANGKRHLCAPDVCGYPRADWTQYIFVGSYDESVAWEYAVPKLAPPKPADPYALFPANVGDPRMPNHGNERLTVEQADGALEHPQRYHDYLKGVCRPAVKAYRDRAKRVSLYQPPKFTVLRQHPDWGEDRGLRWQALNNRIKEIDKIK